ncbi:hypothetical protein LAUMK191_02103 [Mycobacterium attenuatum]|nr:hypothetical protein LAUMK191_02103 [Mycobacterium attenuatum]
MFPLPRLKLPMFPKPTLELPTLPLPRLIFPTFALPRFQKPGFAKPTLKLVPSGPLRYQPAKSLPMFKKPETLAGVPAPVLNRPDTALPKLAIPDCSEP